MTTRLEATPPINLAASAVDAAKSTVERNVLRPPFQFSALEQKENAPLPGAGNGALEKPAKQEGIAGLMEEQYQR
ncbi:MAG: hypothetical protein EOO77_16365 [Oxalobacteraceae bacterium]|nr:MAG: hypothetical protein EOO77_16365 [Oxalobacteraceae bacterium]